MRRGILGGGCRWNFCLCRGIGGFVSRIDPSAYGERICHVADGICRECHKIIHPIKTQVICLDRSLTKASEYKVHTFEMGGFEFIPQWVKTEGEWKLRILPSPSRASKKAIMDKIRSLRLHTRTGSIYVVANLLNPLVRGWQNYYCHFIKRDLNDLWRFVNRRLEKWCKWNKRMNLRWEPQMAQ